MNIRDLKRIIGPFPDKSALRPRVLERVDCGSYTREKIEFSSEKGERIPAYVLIPNQDKKNYPAVYCYHQHAGNWDLGKSEIVGLNGDSSLAYAKDLAEKGFIAFAPDAICFEERKKDADGWFGTYLEYTDRVSHGTTLMGKILHDVIAGVDYLCSRKDVDDKHIGFIGHSYGGRVALWAPVFDRRIKVAVCNCGNVNHADSLKKKYGIQMEFVIPGFMDLGDIEDVVQLIEPNNLLVSATKDDKYSFGYKKLYRKAKPAFQKGELKLAEYPGKHQFTKKMRITAYDFLDKHLRR